MMSKMNNSILVAGGTGDLGNRIIKALIKRKANVVAIVRHSTDNAKVAELVKMGVNVIRVDMSNLAELTAACQGVSCVVSAFAGLRDVIVDTQSLLLDAALAAGVSRFIPSDYSSDITQIAEGENRNFDLRKEFHKKLDAALIAATAIMNGAFSDILAYNTPFYNVKDNSVGYWGNNPDFKVDFTTKDDTANFTAAAALDPTAPKILRIASFQISPNDLISMTMELKKTEFKLVPMGSLEGLSAFNKKSRAENPAGENELYPKWQGSQYMHSMFTAQNIPLDNSRYADVAWTSAHDILAHI
jgi:NAD(P)-dependent dehydrogenase (short-subunit alcohol dehydrogenase family)